MIIKSMSLSARKELLASVRQKYRDSSWIDKGKILDGFVAATGYVKQRGKIARESGKQRRKLSTPICVMIRYFAGETLGVIYGFYCRNQKASFYKR